MIRTKLLPPSAGHETAFELLQESLRLAHQQAKERVAITRQKCARHRRATRRRGYDEGYQAGLREATEEMREAISGIIDTYREAVELARSDISALSRAFAARVIEYNLREEPALAQSLINSAATLLGTSRALTLSHNPRYSELFASLATQLPSHITLRSDENLGDIDFILSGENGDVECSWRKALEEA